MESDEIDLTKDEKSNNDNKVAKVISTIGKVLLGILIAVGVFFLTAFKVILGLLGAFFGGDASSNKKRK